MKKEFLKDAIDEKLDELLDLLRKEAHEEVFAFIDLHYTSDQVNVHKLKKAFYSNPSAS